MRKSRHITLLLAILWPLVSCSQKEEYDLVDTSPIVTVIYPISGLGDRSYVDKIYLGADRASREDGVRVRHLMPSSLEEARDYVLQALEYDPEDDLKRLFIIAETGLDDQFEEFSALVPQDNSRQFMYIDSRRNVPGFHTLYLPLYGVCYEAGVLASSMEGVESVAVINANPHLPTLQEATLAFKDGFGTDGVETLFLTEDYGGYDMAGELYQHSYELDGKYQMTLPLCGGSAQGLFRYNREFPETSFYTIGLDADMSSYSPRVPFSCVKHIDRAIQESIRKWMLDTLPEHQHLGLESGYTELVISEAYTQQFSAALQSIHRTAIEKETEYEKNL